MGLKKIIGSLLPRDYREQVLGDIEEGNFRLRDIVSVVPQIWWSHLRRSLGAPILTDANEAALRHRAQQFQCRSVLALFATMSILTGSSGQEAKFVWAAICLVGYALSCVHFSDRTSRPGREDWIQVHRKQLTRSIASAKWGGYPVLTVLVDIVYRTFWPHQEKFPQLQWQILGLPLFLILGRFYEGRLRKELEALR